MFMRFIDWVFDLVIALFTKIFLGPNRSFSNLNRWKKVAISFGSLLISAILVGLFGMLLVASFNSANNLIKGY